MKRTLNILIFLFFLFHAWSCKDNSLENSKNNTGIEKDSTVQNPEAGSVKTELTKYSKKWVEYVDKNGQKVSELELYISEFGDTLCWNRKIYKNGVLDYTQSNFYDFEARMSRDSTIKGRITLYLQLDHSIKDSVVEKEITVDFVNKLSDSTGVITFNSKNKNYVDFEFKNNSDTIIGLLTEYRRLDLIKNPDSTRMIWSKLPIDSETQTENVFITVHELDKSRR